MVTKITEGSPASDAGLQLNDIITAVDGQKVSSFETLRSALSYYAAGESVTITVQRPNGNQYTETQITVTLADRSTITDTTDAEGTVNLILHWHISLEGWCAFLYVSRYLGKWFECNALET